MKLNNRAMEKRDRARRDKATLFGAWIEVEDDADESHILIYESDSESDEPNAPANNDDSAAAERRVAASSVQNDENMSDENDGPANVPHYRWVQETCPTQKELCSAWLQTEFVKRSLGSDLKLRFNDSLDSDLQLFATSKSSNDSLVDLKREVRRCLAEQRVKSMDQ